MAVAPMDWEMLAQRGSQAAAAKEEASAGGSWTDVTTMTPGTSGSYTARVTMSTTADWQAVFRTPANEGLTASKSSVIRVTVTGTVL